MAERGALILQRGGDIRVGQLNRRRQSERNARRERRAECEREHRGIRLERRGKRSIAAAEHHQTDHPIDGDPQCLRRPRRQHDGGGAAHQRE